MNSHRIIRIINAKRGGSLYYYEGRCSDEGQFHLQRIHEKLHGQSFFHLRYLFPVRPSCFHCHFASYKRPADFSLGDFWNVDSAGIKFDVNGGINEVLVNTEKGRKLFAEISKNSAFQPVSKATGWQPHLEYSAKTPGKQDVFWSKYNHARNLEAKEVLLHKYMKGSMLTRVIRKVNPILQKTGLYSFAGKMYKIVFVKK